MVLSHPHVFKHLQEAKARETIEALKNELDNLSALAESGPERDNEEQIARLMVEKEDLLSERDAQVSECRDFMTGGQSAPDTGLSVALQLCRGVHCACSVLGQGSACTDCVCRRMPVL